jgi:hypothetical protein
MTRPRLRAPILLAAAVLALAPADAFAARHSISGQVLDRNGDPVERAIVTLEPGNVQLITDAEGRFLIDYLRDDDGQRVRLAKKTDYALEVFKPGYHTQKLTFFYKRGPVAVDPIQVLEDTIEVADDGQSLDPGLFGDRTHAAGATYEGQ